MVELKVLGVSDFARLGFQVPQDRASGLAFRVGFRAIRIRNTRPGPWRP